MKNKNRINKIKFNLNRIKKDLNSIENRIITFNQSNPNNSYRTLLAKEAELELEHFGFKMEK